MAGEGNAGMLLPPLLPLLPPASELGGVGGAGIIDDVKMGEGRKGGKPAEDSGSGDDRQRELGDTRGEAETD